MHITSKRATSLDKIIWTTSCNSKCAFYSYLSTPPSTRVHLSKSGNVNIARQVAWHQVPTEPKHSVFWSRAFSNCLYSTSI